MAVFTFTDTNISVTPTFEVLIRDDSPDLQQLPTDWIDGGGVAYPKLLDLYEGDVLFRLGDLPTGTGTEQGLNSLRLLKVP